MILLSSFFLKVSLLAFYFDYPWSIQLVAEYYFIFLGDFIIDPCI